MGQLSKKEWKKEFNRGMKIGGVCFLAFLLFIAICVVGGIAVVTNFDSWTNAEPEEGEDYYNVNMKNSEIKESFQLRTSGDEIDLKIYVDTDKNTTHDLGQFHLEFTRVELFDGTVPSDAFVLYYPPEEWYTKEAIERAKYEEIHIPIEKQKVGVDPTFYADQDYPSALYPFDEIEITTNKVIKLVDKNETIYDFYVRVLETNEEFNIEDLRVTYTQ